MIIFGQDDFNRWLFNELQSIKNTLSQILEKGDTIMAKVAELEGKLDSIAQVVESVATDQTVLKDEIQSLKDQLAAGGTITEAQLDSALAKATALEARLQGIDASVPPVTP